MVQGWRVGTLGRQICAQAWPMLVQGSSVMLHCHFGACSEAVPCCHCHKPASTQPPQHDPCPNTHSVSSNHMGIALHVLLCSRDYPGPGIKI